MYCEVQYNYIAGQGIGCSEFRSGYKTAIFLLLPHWECFMNGWSCHGYHWVKEIQFLRERLIRPNTELRGFGSSQFSFP